MRVPVPLFVVLLLAGCLGTAPPTGPLQATDPSATSADSPKSTLEQRQEDRDGLGARHGAVEGVVRDEFLQPIPGAHVSILSTPNSTTSDKRGAFAFPSLREGRYTIRADHVDFASLEAEITVQGGKVTVLNVTLAFLEDPERKFIGTAHRHDWWAAEKEVVIMDRDIPMGVLGVCASAIISNGCYSSFLVDGTLGTPMGESRIVFSSPPDENTRPNIVFEGAGRMKVQIQIDGNVLHPFDVQVKVPDKDLEPGKYASLRKAAQVTGASTSFEMEVLENNTDAAHFRRSGWEFYLQPTKATLSQPASAYQGKMHWKVTVYRSDRELPTDAPHPDYWGDLTEQNLLTKSCTGSYTPASLSGSCQNEVQPEPKRTVTIGTGKMTVTLTWTQTHPTPVKIGLEYLGADTVRDTYYVQWTRPPVAEEGNARRVYTFDVRADQWDSPYLEESEWRFRMFIDTPPPHDTLKLWEGTLTYKVDIFKQS